MTFRGPTDTSGESRESRAEEQRANSSMPVSALFPFAERLQPNRFSSCGVESQVTGNPRFTVLLRKKRWWRFQRESSHWLPIADSITMTSNRWHCFAICSRPKKKQNSQCDSLTKRNTPRTDTTTLVSYMLALRMQCNDGKTTKNESLH